MGWRQYTVGQNGHTIHIILSVSEFKSALVPFIALLYILYTSQLQLPGSVFNLFFSFSVSQVWKFSGLCTLLSVCCIPQFSTVSLQGSCAKAAVSRTWNLELEMDYACIQWNPPSLLLCQCLSTWPLCEAVWTELLGSLAFLLPPQSTLSMPHCH